ncbi:hypothetical protein [Kocuria carniphila]|uniref:hypothetical protein n=1 Tax=Kocuria carniphila TaxID=262208 RepID=UPI0028EDE7C4|nr:hypothetical protein [Kocuria carniphila]
MSTYEMHPRELHRSGSAWRRALPGMMSTVAMVLVIWVVFGRILVDALGSLVWVYAFALGLPLMVLHTVAAVLFSKDAKFYPSQAVTQRAGLTAIGSWIVTALFGFFLPDSTPDGPESVFTALTGPDMLGISYGFANTFGVISMAMAVALVLLALTDLHNTRRAMSGEPLSEDELLDRMEAQHARGESGQEGGAAASSESNLQ